MQMRQTESQALYETIKAEAAGKKGLAELVDAFERMCRIEAHTDDDAKLFETGVFGFTGEPLYYFGLTRQLPNGEGEYCQIQLNVTYAPTKENQRHREEYWQDDTDRFFAHVRKSKAYKNALQETYISYEVLLEET